jgi:hypothetical protein
VVVVDSMVVVVDSTVVVVVVAPGQTQPGWHSSNAPLGELGSVQLKLFGGSQSSPGSTLPSPHEGDGSVVVVVDAGQPPFGQASQQLVAAPTHTLPPSGALHSEASRLMRHLVFPLRSTEQQVTAFGMPQVDFKAHWNGSKRHSSRSWPLSTRFFATRHTHFR